MVITTAWTDILAVFVSVLALSSRFDGHKEAVKAVKAGVPFQYSLCRVVLMVEGIVYRPRSSQLFQYSLCRVVLMVTGESAKKKVESWFQYSLCRVVLMVSEPVRLPVAMCFCFSTRSVESF